MTNCNNMSTSTATATATTTPPAAAPITTKRPKARPSPYSKVNPILISSDRQARKRKSITWQPDDKIRQVHYFELIADERINVTRTNACAVASNADPQQLQQQQSQQQQHQQQLLMNTDANASLASSSLNSVAAASAAAAATGRSNAKNNNLLKTPKAAGGAAFDAARRSDKCIEYLSWRPLILIDFASELPSPGWNSLERSAQAERETYVLGAIDLPGQASTLDEPDCTNLYLNHQEGLTMLNKGEKLIDITD